MAIQQFISAEPGWRALFEEPDGELTRSRVVGWALVATGKDVAVVGMIVDPVEPTRLLAAPDATSPDGGSFSRYAYSPDA
jgi:hypothetical protein